jgi:hypothetical protein
MAKTKLSSVDPYQAKWDLDTLRQAKEIEANKARMSAATNYAKEQVKMLGGIVSGSGKAPAKKSTPKKK